MVLIEWFEAAQQTLFEAIVQPLMFGLGLGHLLSEGYAATGWLLVGVAQLAVILVVLRPLERWRPVEPMLDRAAVRVDVIYTLVHRLGLFRLAMFFTLGVGIDAVAGSARAAGWFGWQLDDLWPGLTDRAWVAFVLYLVLFDFIEYWIHRGQHHFNAWWALHALHHSQRQMTVWSDDRNHLLDDVARDLIFALVAQLIGLPPAQFVALVALGQLSQSLQHANLRMHFGRLGERLWVSPRFHRLHHSVGIGHESRGAGTLGGANFGVLLPWWDMLFGTANFSDRYDPTGIRDQVEAGRDYGHGFWGQQDLGVRRFFCRK